MFENSKLKIGRASEQCDELCKGIASFTESENYVIEEIQDFQTGEKQAIFKVTKEFPSEWPLIIGDIAHNLRSGLDHAVYECERRITTSPLASSLTHSPHDYNSHAEPEDCSGFFSPRPSCSRPMPPRQH